MSLKYFFKKIAKSILYKLVELSLHSIKRKENGKNNKKLLIVRIDAVGDFIVFSPMLKYYRMLYPGYRITLLVNRLVLDLAERFGEVDELVAFDRKRFSRDLIYRRNLLKEIKKGNFDTVIYPAYSREPNGDNIVRFSGAAEKIGFDGDICNISQKEKRKNNKYYTKLTPATQGVILEVERNKEFVEAFGMKVKDNMPFFTPSEKDEIEARKLLFNNGLNDSKAFAVICPGASWEGRMWPLEKYAEVANRLKKENDFEIVVCGSEHESNLSEIIETITGFRIIDITGKTTLPVLAAVLKSSLLYIGNDTGILHLAVSVGTPAVSIIGGGHFGRFFPYGDLSKNRIVYKSMDCFWCNWQCLYLNKIGKPVPCISNIHVNDVAREIGVVLNGTKEIHEIKTFTAVKEHHSAI